MVVYCPNLYPIPDSVIINVGFDGLSSIFLLNCAIKILKYCVCSILANPKLTQSPPLILFQCSLQSWVKGYKEIIKTISAI